MLSFCGFSDYEKNQQALLAVQDELEKTITDKNTFQRDLANLEAKFTVMETLRESQEVELQTLKVKKPAIKPWLRTSEFWSWLVSSHFICHVVDT